MVGGMSGGYVPGLANTWPSYGAVTSPGGYPASAYLGYNTGLASASQATSYSASALTSMTRSLFRFLPRSASSQNRWMGNAHKKTPKVQTTSHMFLFSRIS